MRKTLTVVLTAALVASVFWAIPADAKKKKKKPKPAPVCATFVPGAAGAEAETVVVTDAATAEAPVLVPVTLAEEFSEGLTSHAEFNFNVQVDSVNPTAGLYVTFEFDTRRDYDLWAYWPTENNDEAASSHGFNPLVEADIDTPAGNPSNTATNHAGESKADSENLIGVITPDCGGYTISAHNYLGEGGDFEIKVWLGEGVNEPKPIP